MNRILFIFHLFYMYVHKYVYIIMHIHHIHHMLKDMICIQHNPRSAYPKINARGNSHRRWPVGQTPPKSIIKAWLPKGAFPGAESWWLAVQKFGSRSMRKYCIYKIPCTQGLFSRR